MGQHKAQADEVVLQGAYSPNGDFNKHFSETEPTDRNNLLWDMRIGLLGMDVDFQGLTEPLERVDVTTRIFADALTKDRFFERLSKVERALLFLSWTVGRRVLGPNEEDAGWVN